MAADAAGVQGSGWAWLGYNKERDAVQVVTTANQDPCITTGLIPLLGIESIDVRDVVPRSPQLSNSHVVLMTIQVWEHAYYLQYKNVRPDYLKAIWSVVNFKDVAARLAAAKKA